MVFAVLLIRQKIHLNASEENLCINIGPNGSGKSNFLEVLSNVFSGVLFQSYRFNMPEYRNYRNPPAGGKLNRNGVITKNQLALSLPLNKKTVNNSEQVIKLTICVSDNDISNFNYIDSIRTEIDYVPRKL